MAALARATAAEQKAGQVQAQLEEEARNGAKFEEQVNEVQEVVYDVGKD